MRVSTKTTLTICNLYSFVKLCPNFTNDRLVFIFIPPMRTTVGLGVQLRRLGKMLLS
jgi:hypothetical protein